jgi:hypothetical protein
MIDICQNPITYNMGLRQPPFTVPEIIVNELKRNAEVGLFTKPSSFAVKNAAPYWHPCGFVGSPRGKQGAICCENPNFFKLTFNLYSSHCAFLWASLPTPSY